MARYASILETGGHTPVVRINRLAPLGVTLYLKVEAFNPLGSSKNRLALGVIEAAERSGELKPGQHAQGRADHAHHAGRASGALGACRAWGVEKRESAPARTVLAGLAAP